MSESDQEDEIEEIEIEGDQPQSEDPIINLLQNYHSLNANVVDELDEEPSALEFMRYVAKNRPFVVRGAAKDWAALQKWDAEYLREKMGDSMVKVVSTPHGNADAIVKMPNGSKIFVEPYEGLEPFDKVLEYIQQDSQLSKKEALDSSTPPERLVKYAQTQNNNLSQEYPPLLPDLPSSIPFARIALAQPTPEAVNFWLGNARSTTALHKDNYENLYVVIRGSKQFILLSPYEMVGVGEERLPRGRYVKREERLEVEVDETAERVPVATWDPEEDNDEGDESGYRFLVKPLRVTVREGDMLYLPAMWYHKVKQTCGEEDFVCAVNYWYDTDFAGHFYSGNAFLRDVFDARQRMVQYPELKVEDGEHGELYK